MTQPLAGDWPIDPTVTSGTALADILNRFAGSVGTSNAGATAPTNTQPGMLWYDTSGANPVLRMRNAANTGWVTVVDVGAPPITAGALAPYATTASMTAADNLRVLKSGDTMTGGLTTPRLALNSSYYLGVGGSGHIINLAASWYFDFNTSNGTLMWNAGPSGTKTVFQPNGDFQAAGRVGSSGGAGPSLRFDGGGANFLHMQGGSSGAWSWQWNTANGALYWLGGSGEVLFNMAPNGTLSVSGGFGCGALSADNVTVSGANGVNVPNGPITSGGSMTSYGRLSAMNGLDIIGGQIGFTGGTTFSAGAGGINFAQMGQNGNTTYVNALNAQPAGLAMVLSFQHSPGQFANIELQNGQAVYDFRSDNTAYKGGGATTWAIPSDRRLKQDIADYMGGLNEILALQPRTFHYKNNPDGALCFGIVADEAEPVMPEIITTAGGMIDDVWTDDVKSLYADPVQWALVNAVKTLHQRIAALESAPS